MLLCGRVPGGSPARAAESLGAALQYFTGSKAHNIALRDRAIQRGLKLNEYGLFRVDDDARVAGETEEGIYAALGLALVPPELRENRGEIEAAEAGTLPRLIAAGRPARRPALHTTATDGRDDIETMARAAQARRARVHRASPITARRWRWPTASTKRARSSTRARSARSNARLDGITLLAGIECDIRADGTMDLADDCLAQLDFVDRVRPLGVQPGRGADDRPAAAGDRNARGSTCSATRPAA